MRLASFLAGASLLGLIALQTGCGASALSEAKTKADVMRAETSALRLEASGDEAGRFGDMTRAEQYYVAALKAGGDERGLAQKLVIACVTDGRFPAAIQYAEDYLLRHPRDVGLRFASAAMSAAIGDGERARTGYETVIASQPDLAEAHYALASLLTDVEDADLRKDHYRTYVKLAPRGAYAESARAALRGAQ